MRRALVALFVLALTLPVDAQIELDKRQFSVLGCGPQKPGPGQDAAQFANDDPIVRPGEIGASHLHQFTGALGITANSTYGDHIGGLTDCNYSKDTAGYWFPALLDSSGNPVAALVQNVYYRNLPAYDADVKAFPPGLEIVAGGHQNEMVVGFSCSDVPPPWSSTLIDCSTGKLLGRVRFPECWDGTSIRAPDDRSHMAYANPDGCPPDHPVRVPRVQVNIQWNIPDAASGGYRLSSDLPGQQLGESLHADFWNIWDQKELERLIRVCIRQGGDVAESLTDPSCKDLRDA